MITTIKIHGPATFSSPATLTTDKKVNLIYGLNGTGKSTVCRFLRSMDGTDYALCEVTPTPAGSTVYVYNEEFVRENFYESDMMKGIFSLSKENKEAEARIGASKKKLESLIGNMDSTRDALIAAQAKLLHVRQSAEDTTWKIKTSYAGGDRVLEYCLDGLKGKKETLFSHLISVAKPNEKPQFDAQSLKVEAQSLSSSDLQLVTPLPLININAVEIESDDVFNTPIIGNENATVAKLINKLGNSDWVREGLNFVDKQEVDQDPVCPFCQEETITDGLVGQIKDFFDESYERNLATVNARLAEYRDLISSVPSAADYSTHQFSSQSLELLLKQFISELQANLLKIESKYENPSSEVRLANTGSLVTEINAEIGRINILVDAHTEKLRNKSKALEDVKTRFWALMRWEYDQTISRLAQDQREVNASFREHESKLSEIGSQIEAVTAEIAEAQKATVNIDEAILSINRGLVELGIDDFSIEKHDETLYRLKRTSGRGSSRFSTLSEGEKMIITLLYFCELCKGRRNPTDTSDDKIVVFDDPISSLSHIYIFNVGQLIRSTFFLSSVAKQVFVFTHSLYFFYEMADPKKERRDENQALFRMTKANGQSQFRQMKYEEIQNDYQAYWQIINNADHHPALIANCMRNIVDYFFGFVEKLEYTNVFQKPAFKQNKFQAFSRYMNRESHSFGQNVYDLKEFDYDVFKDGLRLVFEESGYPDHYKKMSKI